MTVLINKKESRLIYFYISAAYVKPFNLVNRANQIEGFISSDSNQKLVRLNLPYYPIKLISLNIKSHFSQ
jgi:hypothetical protein